MAVLTPNIPECDFIWKKIVADVIGYERSLGWAQIQKIGVLMKRGDLYTSMRTETMPCEHEDGIYKLPASLWSFYLSERIMSSPMHMCTIFRSLHN